MSSNLTDMWRTSNRVTFYRLENLPGEVTAGLWQWSKRAKEV